MNLKTIAVVVALLWTSLAAAAAPARAKFDVKNMTCAACSLTIEKALGKVPGVSSSHVDAQANIVTVEFDAKRTNAGALATVITNAGFPAKPIPAGQ